MDFDDMVLGIGSLHHSKCCGDLIIRDDESYIPRPYCTSCDSFVPLAEIGINPERKTQQRIINHIIIMASVKHRADMKRAIARKDTA